MLRNVRSLYKYKAVILNSSRAQRVVCASTLTSSFCESVKLIVGEGNATTSETARAQHGRDESYHESLPPDLLVYPSNVIQVSEVVKLCSSNRVAVIPFGTGTGLEGGVGAVGGGVALNLMRMDQIFETDSDNFYATVGPGVTRHSLNTHLRDTGLWFPVDPGADASLCGMVATNASGTNAVRYGTVKENVLNLEVVLASGDIVHTSGTKCRARKSSAGYNLTGLFIGSEGTLGVITSATLKLYGIPEFTSSAVCSFPSISDAVNTTMMVMQSGIPVARIEFLDEVMMDASNKYSGLSYDVASTLFFEFHGSENSVNEQAEIAKEIAEENSCGQFRWATDPEARSKLWKARHDALYAAKGLLPGVEVLITDVCVPISSLPQVIVETKQVIKQSGLVAPIVGHVGDGNFHCIFLIKPGDTKQLDTVKEISLWMGRLAIRSGGTCTGEHGVGRGKIQLVEEEYGEEGVGLMRRVKSALDPLGIMNPGKIIRSDFI